MMQGEPSIVLSYFGRTIQAIGISSEIKYTYTNQREISQCRREFGPVKAFASFGHKRSYLPSLRRTRKTY